MNGSDSPDNLSKSEEESSEINLEVKNLSLFKKYKPV